MNHNNELEYILKPLICDTNYFSCSYQTGRWPKPHDCGLPEALKAVTAHFNKKFEECLPEKKSKNDEWAVNGSPEYLNHPSEIFNDVVDRATQSITKLFKEEV